MKYHNYIFLTGKTSLSSVSEEDIQKYRTEFLKILDEEENVVSNIYTTLGLKVNTAFLIWFQSDVIETTQELLNRLMHTQLGKHLTISYTLFGMTRQTQYSSHASAQLDTGRKGAKYLIIYPFSKTKEWYLLDFKKRKTLMDGHIAIGKNYPQITQLLLYSYGIDDNEFIVSYETDDLSMFQSLIIDLRSDKVRAYTLKDTPIFTCIYRMPEEAIRFL